MPLHRRLPKRGFTNIFKKQWLEVSLAALDEAFDANEEITPEVLAGHRLAGKKDKVKVLGEGSLDRKVTVRAHAFSAGARAKIEAAGGTAELLES